MDGRATLRLPPYMSESSARLPMSAVNIEVPMPSVSTTAKPRIGPGKFNAELVTLYNSAKTTNGVVTFPGSLLVDNRSLLLRPGLTATAEIKVAEVKNVLLVPNAALRFTPPPAALDNKPAPPPAKPQEGKALGRVWTLVSNKPEHRDLVLGRTDGVSTQILSGKLAVGDTVLTDIKSQIVRPTTQ